MLDWELSTLGHPAADLALATMPYDTPEGMPKAFRGFGRNPQALGVPSEQGFIDAYVEATGLASVRTHIDYYRAFCCFRMASILQGVYKRSLAGQASSADGAQIGKLAGAVAQLGAAIAERYEKSPDRLTKAAGAGAAFESVAKAGKVAVHASPTSAASAVSDSEYEALKQRMVDFMHEGACSAALELAQTLTHTFELTHTHSSTHVTYEAEHMTHHPATRRVDSAPTCLASPALPLPAAEIYPNEVEFAKQNHAFSGTNEWTHPPILVDLMAKAKARGLWNLFLPRDSAALVDGRYGAGLTNLQYADLCEIQGTSIHGEMAAQATNCTSPDTGNMETIARFGTAEQKERWLKPLLEGKIRSCFAMTEPDVASSDATNVAIDIQKDGSDYVINGRKWWCTGAGSLHTQIMILMGKTDPTNASIHKQQSMLLVPMDTPGIRLVRPLCVFGDDDAPKGHMEIAFEDCRVPQSSILWGEGKGFEIAQRRLGPGRIHHCMRAIGQAERALSLMCARSEARVAFGKPLAKRDTVIDSIAKCRADIAAMRHLVREAAHLMDTKGNTDLHTRQLLSIVKALVPATVQRIADQAMQVHGAAGMCQDTPLATIFSSARLLRLADGPDEVHWRKAGQLELQNQRESRLRGIGLYTPARDETEPFFRYTTDPISAKSAAAIAQFEDLMSE